MTPEDISDLDMNLVSVPSCFFRVSAPFESGRMECWIAVEVEHEDTSFTILFAAGVPTGQSE